MLCEKIVKFKEQHFLKTTLYYPHCSRHAAQPPGPRCCVLQLLPQVEMQIFARAKIPRKIYRLGINIHAS